MPWYIYLALKQLFPTGRKFPFFTAISVLGVSLGVALLIVSISVMGGFGHEIRRMIVDTQGDVQIRGTGLINDSDAITSLVSKVPGVTGVTPFAEGVVMLEYNRKPIFPTIQGVDLEHVNDVIPLSRYIHEGTLDDLDDDTIILSSQLAYSIGAGVGDKVQISSPLQLEKLRQDEVFLPRELTVSGIFEIGHQQLDSSTVIVTLRRMQDLYGLGHAVHGFDVKIADGLDPDIVARRINAALPLASGLEARSWVELNQDFLFVLQLEKNLIFILLLFIIVVAAFSVTSSLLISVVRKTREIGLLGALGGKPVGVALCFCFQGLLIGVSGTVCGLALGFGFLHVRNDVLHLFTKLTGSQEALERFYQFSNVPAFLQTGDLVMITTSTIVISTLAGIIPAWRAARLKPVEALRNE
ncbi:MAG TPA: ABC transporter permease [Rariglobus sp.]|jgi:lipoprotein-releasing system permease protein|nr:ABC transporter permease [Rariglobus sp.]